MKQFGKLYWHLNDKQEILKSGQPELLREETDIRGLTSTDLKRLRELLLLTGAIYSVAICTTPHFSGKTVMIKELMNELMEIKTTLYMENEETVDPIENLLLDVRESIKGNIDDSTEMFPSIQNPIYEENLNSEKDSSAENCTSV